MKKTIKLYRPKIFKIISGLLLLIFICDFALSVLQIAVFGIKDLFFMDWELYKSPLNDFLIFEDILRCMIFFIGMACDLLLSALCFIGAFCNKMIIKEDRIIFLYPPRLFFRIYTCNICRITPVKYKDIPVMSMILNFATNNEYLYKIEEYERTYYVACRAKTEMDMLAEEINSKGKKTERESEDYDSAKITGRDILMLCLIAICAIAFLKFAFHIFASGFSFFIKKP